MCFTLLQEFLLQVGEINVKPESLGGRRAESCFLACLQNSKLAPGRRSEEVVVLRDKRNNLKPDLWFKNIFKSEWWVFLVVRCLRATAIRVASGFFSSEDFFSLLAFGGISWSLVALERFPGIVVGRVKVPSPPLWAGTRNATYFVHLQALWS